MIFASGLLLAFAGCLGFYLSSRHQRLLTAPLPARPARIASALLLVGSLGLLSMSVQPLVAIYVLSTWTMLLLILLPYAVGLRQLVKREGGR